jgi:hypothetical protein
LYDLPLDDAKGIAEHPRERTMRKRSIAGAVALCGEVRSRKGRLRGLGARLEQLAMLQRERGHERQHNQHERCERKYSQRHENAPHKTSHVRGDE